MEFKTTGNNWIIKGDYKSMEIYSKEYNVPICALARQSSFESDIDSQQLANAKLISKSPRLLEALKTICDHLEDVLNEHGSESLEKRTAIVLSRELIKEATTI